MGTEKDMWAGLRDRLKRRGKFRGTRIENLLGAGTLDINFTLNGKGFWVESKWSPYAAKETAFLLQGHKMSSEQENFCLAEYIAGGRVYVWVRHDRRGNYLFPGKVAHLVNGITIVKAAPFMKSMDQIVEIIVSS